MGRKGDERTDTARTKVRQYKNDPKGKPSPIPLEECPWCGDAFTPDSFTLLPDDDQPDRAADRLRELRLRLQRRPAAADRRRRRADLPAAAGVPDRDRRQVRDAAVGRPSPACCSAAPTRHDAARASTAPASARPAARPLPAPLAAARPRHPGRAAPDLRPARDDGRALRDGHRRAVLAHADGAGVGRRSSPRPPPSAARRTRSRRSSAADRRRSSRRPGRIARDSFFAQTVPAEQRPPGCTSASPRRAATRRS